MKGAGIIFTMSKVRAKKKATREPPGDPQTRDRQGLPPPWPSSLRKNFLVLRS